MVYYDHVIIIIVVIVIIVVVIIVIVIIVIVIIVIIVNDDNDHVNSVRHVRSARYGLVIGRKMCRNRRANQTCPAHLMHLLFGIRAFLLSVLVSASALRYWIFPCESAATLHLPSAENCRCVDRVRPIQQPITKQSRWKHCCCLLLSLFVGCCYFHLVYCWLAGPWLTHDAFDTLEEMCQHVRHCRRKDQKQHGCLLLVCRLFCC